MFSLGKYLLIICVFILGLVAAAGYDFYSEQGKEQPYSESGIEISSPNNRIIKEDIKIYNDSILINIENAAIASFTDTNSMDPLIDENSNSIEIKPYDLKIGDVVSYYNRGKKIIHRIVDISEDENGTYYIMKGDNNRYPDKGKVRFGQISGVVIGILY